MNSNERLAELGWNPDFLRQLELDEIGVTNPARVSGIHRNRIDVLTMDGPLALIPASDLSTGAVAVGDWLLERNGIALRVLDRRTELARKAAGSTVARQLIAANLDAALIVSSCNADFNVGRLERYLVLAASAGIEPIIVLTKADTCADPSIYVEKARAMQRGLAVVALNAHADDVPAALSLWCRKGQTVVLLGSSGVGKTTLSNALTGGSAAVQDIRADDSKGRHTTTARSLVQMATGGWLIDTPGVRELQVTDAADGIETLYDDLTEIAKGCRFSDCQHGAEPGCAVKVAIAAGGLDDGRLARWQKLKREDRFNTQTIHEAHLRNRTFGRMHRKITDKRKPK